MKGETANITHLCEFGWYDWVYFRDNAVTYPKDKWVLGRWLGPSTDIGPALFAEILKRNGRCVYRSSYRHLTEDEQNSPEERKKRQSYNQMVHTRLGSPATHRTLKSIIQLVCMIYMRMMMGMVFPMPRNLRMNQFPSHMTHTLVLKVFCQKEMTWFLGLSSQESRILKDTPLEKLMRIQSWTQGSTMLNSQMVKMQDWVPISLQNACMLSVILKGINTDLWTILRITGRTTRQFPKITKMSHCMARHTSRGQQEDGNSE